MQEVLGGISIIAIGLKHDRPAPENTDTRSVFEKTYLNYYLDAGAGAADPSAGAADPSAGAAEPSAGAGAGAGASTFGASGAGSSFFLQPTTEKEKVTNKSRERTRADTFFINVSPPFNLSIVIRVDSSSPLYQAQNTLFFCLVKKYLTL